MVVFLLFVLLLFLVGLSYETQIKDHFPRAEEMIAAGLRSVLPLERWSSLYTFRKHYCLCLADLGIQHSP